MEIHQLEYVLALEKHMHFSKAANEIAVSQANLSQQIKKLENELGITLFTRNNRSIKITKAGEEFIQYAKKIVFEIKKAQVAMLEHTNLSKGSVKIGANKSIIYLGIASIIAKFQKLYPGLAIEIYEANSPELVKKLHNSEIDVAFITVSDSLQEDYEFSPLLEERLGLLTSITHHLATKDVVNIGELSEESFLVIKSSNNHNSLIQLCQSYGYEPKIILAGTQIETLKGLIEEDIGISLFSSNIAKKLLSSKTSFINLEPHLKTMYGLATPKHASISTKAFRDFVLSNGLG
ncbi:LysR family transcriptional regulator [Bacillus sp. Marseille-P3661]|uniref:LysR family transcriptional regulator n=1 Tax=Bacillus sp. Marseille-P3661 TaxID=1936234 RepID=UPI000C820FE6|nr:LysR family transcriptional regulator [Bacillus sp. Marseille-P3661]